MLHSNYVKDLLLYGCQLINLHHLGDDILQRVEIENKNLKFIDSIKT